MKRRAALAVLICGAMAVAARGADPFMEARDAAALKGPPGVKFDLAAGKQFHMGEVIRLAYTFQAAGGEMLLDNAPHDAPGRWVDVFHVDRQADVVDPLHDFSVLIGRNGAAEVPRAPVALGENPQRMEVALNGWLRFKAPGHYRIYVESNRVKGEGKPAVEWGAAVSNVVEFEILPMDADWSAKRLKEIVGTLDGTGGAAEKREALRELCYLNTAGAWGELSRRFNGSSGDDLEFMAALVGAADPRAALEAMAKELVSPDHAVTPPFMQTLVALDLEVDGGVPETRQGIMISGMGIMRDPQMDKRRADALRKHVAALVASLPKKNWPARATCLMTLEQRPAAEGRGAPDEKLAVAMADEFEKLPVKDQVGVLRDFWLHTRTPALLPALKVLLNTKPDASGDEHILRNWALARAYELDPVEMRGAVLEEMGRPGQRRETNETGREHLLRVLPDATLPEMDATFLSMLKAGRSTDPDVVMGLVSRYGSPGILPQMKEYFEPHAGSWACALQAAMLAYILRVDEGYGIEQFKRCLASRKTGCWKTLFRDVGQQVWTPMLEQLAGASLDDPEAEVAATAARMLEIKGSAAAKAILLAALRRPYTPSAQGKTSTGQDSEKRRNETIVAALLGGHAWVLSEEELGAVESLAIDHDSVQRYRAARADAVNVAVGTAENGTAYFRLGTTDYGSLKELENKLSLFPAATLFKAEGKAWDPPYQGFIGWAREKGMKMQ